MTVSPSVISNTYPGVITLQINGIPAGDQVQIQKYLDLNGSGVMQTNDLLMDAFYITDNGTDGIIGGVTNVNVPIDTDAATGAITTTLNFAAPLPLDNMVGHYIYQLSSPAQHFSPITATFVVTNANTGQSVSGIIYSNGITPLPYAVVLAQSTATGSHTAGAAVADSSGHYQLSLNPGIYSLLGSFRNFYFDTALAPVVTLTNTAGTDATTNLSLTNGTVTISGAVFGESGGSTNALGGVLLQFTDYNLFASAFTDSNGNYSASVSPNNWVIGFVRDRLARRAYVVSLNPLQVNTTANPVVTNVVAYQGNALFHGQITDNSNHPFANVEFLATDSSNRYTAIGYSDQTGNYAVAVLGGLTNDLWIENVSVGLPDYIFNTYQSTNIAVNQTLPQNFVCLPITAQISGQVQEQSAGPVAGVGLLAGTTVNGLDYSSADAVTDAAGDYTLDVAAGNWQVQFATDNPGSSLANHGLVDLNGPYFVTIPPTNVTLNLTVYTNGTPSITQPARLSGTEFGFNIGGSLNAYYTVQVSTNLASTNWSALQTFLLTTNPYAFEDLHATNSPRFYRVLEN
jgi:hypothetical protein